MAEEINHCSGCGVPLWTANPYPLCPDCETQIEAELDEIAREQQDPDPDGNGQSGGEDG